jgi:hypothetical protein
VNVKKGVVFGEEGIAEDDGGGLLEEVGDEKDLGACASF